MTSPQETVGDAVAGSAPEMVPQSRSGRARHQSQGHVRARNHPHDRRLRRRSPLLAPYDPAGRARRTTLPVWSTAADGKFHALGTDHLGRDILSRLIYGARISLVVGIGASVVAGTIGVLFGLVSGYFGGLVDDVIMRLTDIQLALPYILLAIALLAIVGSGLFNITSLCHLMGDHGSVRSDRLSPKRRRNTCWLPRRSASAAAGLSFVTCCRTLFAPIIVTRPSRSRRPSSRRRR
jgi:ABC-type dipeptide/oligopeptide/nickel transport system permease subunit